MKSKKITYIPKKIRDLIAVFSASVFAFSACTSDIDYSKLSAEDAYKSAETEFANENYISAATAYASIDKNYPYSSLATVSLLKGAFAYYKDKKFSDALDLIYKFLVINPSSPEVPYAYYLQALCHLEQMADYRRDQSETLEALKSIEYLQKNYPDNVYTKELLPHIQVLNNQLASKILQTGKGELRINNFSAAINNFQMVIKKYPKSDIVPEALYRLVETYTSSQLFDMRGKIYSKMIADYPDNIWTSRAKKLTEKYPEQNAKSDASNSESKPN